MITTEEIIVANTNCNGCIAAIRKELLKLDNVSAAEVFIDRDTVKITYDNRGNNKARIINRLYELGYPEATEENGLLTQVKSYTSCMIGRLSNV
jgi:copper chaperone